jgi:hypothetical protein
MTNAELFAGFSNEWFTAKAADYLRDTEPRHLYAPVEPRKMQGPPKPRYPLCFWDQDAPEGTPLCRVSRMCRTLPIGG